MYTRRFSFFLIIIIFSSALALSSDAANLGGYIVSPVPPGMDPGTPLETKEVSFWELPPNVIALSLALSVSPVLEFGVQLMLLVKLYAYLGYRKITGSTLFNNNARNQIYACIRDNPGIFFNSIVRKTGIKSGTLHYHLLLLHSMKKISVLTSEGHARYFENSGVFSESEKAVLKYIQNETDNRILRLLLDDSELNRKDLAEKLGMSGVMVTWYMKRLTSAGIITVQKDGKNSRYSVPPDMRHYLEKYLLLKSDTQPSYPYEHISESA